MMDNENITYKSNSGDVIKKPLWEKPTIKQINNPLIEKNPAASETGTEAPAS